jgi:2-amino-4-hydroxy-6-hydroxymethyldihydropteridine diphosphokinase
MIHEAYIGLGSNLGRREETLDHAIVLLARSPGVEVLSCSCWVQTAPVGGPEGQGDYLNGAAGLRTTLGPEELLARLLEIEAACGRDRACARRWGPRTCDLDLLLYDDLCRHSANLTLPHPRMCQRAFVLEPLARIASDVVHPQAGKSIRQLLAELGPQQ